MPALESVQFEVGLTKDKLILQQLRTNKLWRRDSEGDYLSIQFDAQEFKFRPGKTFIVGKSVGNALIRSSAVLLGTDPLSDPYVAFVEKLQESSLGQETVIKRKSQFSCPICNEDQKSEPKLARHLMDKHPHPKEESPSDPNDQLDA